MDELLKSIAEIVGDTEKMARIAPLVEAYKDALLDAAWCDAREAEERGA